MASAFDSEWRQQTRLQLTEQETSRQRSIGLNTQWEDIETAISDGDISTKSFIETAKLGLTENQREAMNRLIAIGDTIPYEDIVQFESELAQRIVTLERKILDVNTEAQQELDALQNQYEKLCEISPQLSKTLSETLEIEKSKVIHSKTELLELELECAKIDYEEAAQLFEQAGQAWPLPSLIELAYQPTGDEQVTIDSFPDERAADTKKIGEKVRGRHYNGKLSDASTYLALLLVEKPGHIWTSDELGEEIYDDGGTDRYANKISALISNHRTGKVPTIQTILSEGRAEPYVLQRGIRHRFDNTTGRLVPRSKKTVWRVVDRETAAKAVVITTISNDKQHRESYSEWEPTSQFDVQIRPATKKTSPPLDSEQNVIVVATQRIQNPHPETVPEDNVPEATKEDNEKWQDKFVESIHETIEKMKAQGLMDAPKVSWKLLRQKSDSSIAGTQRTRERAYQHRIITRREMAEDAIITLSQAILSMVQNSFPNIFDSKTRRKEAVQIVDEIVVGFLKSHNSED